MILKFYKYLFFRIYRWFLLSNKEENSALRKTIMALVFTEVASINLFFELINRYTTIEITSPFSTIPMALFSVGILYFFNYYLFEKDEKFQEINNTFLKKKETDKLWFIKGVLVVLLIAGILLFYMIYPYKLVLF